MFVFAENVGSLQTQISPEIQKPKYLMKKTKQKNSLKARQGRIEHVCKLSGSNSQKRRGHWRLKEFGVLRLNQAVVSKYKKKTSLRSRVVLNAVN